MSTLQAAIQAAIRPHRVGAQALGVHPDDYAQLPKVPHGRVLCPMIDGVRVYQHPSVAVGHVAIMSDAGVVRVELGVTA